MNVKLLAAILLAGLFLFGCTQSGTGTPAASTTATLAASVQATPQATVLAFRLDPALAASQPFAALRSMFVTTAQSDVAVASWPAVPNGSPILDFTAARTPTIRFGRQQPSRHNLSAPDLVFEDFAESPR